MTDENDTIYNITEAKFAHLPVSVLICTITGSSLSIIGGIIIFVTYVIVQEARNRTRRLLIYLTVADVLTCGGNLFGTVRYALRDEDEYITRHKEMERNCKCSDETCVLQSFITTFSSMASFFWTDIIILHIFLTLVHQSEWGFKTRTKVACHLMSWGLPFLITMTAVCFDVLGENFSISSGPWCWIKGCLKSKEIIMWMAITGKGWEIMTYLFTIAIYINIKIYMFRLQRLQNRRVSYKLRSGNKLRDEDEIYIMIWFAIIILRIFGTVRFGIAVYKLVKNDVLEMFNDIDMILLHLQSIGDSGQAFFNCILFCLHDRTVRTELGRKIKNLCIDQSEDEKLIRNDKNSVDTGINQS